MIAFIILHYKNVSDTLECIKSVSQLKSNQKIKIVVVDNHTLEQEELEKLKEYTKDILLLEKNEGFAKANNKGCAYAISKYHPDFLVVINNDTIMIQKDFINRIQTIYKETNFDLLGPWIECPPFSGSVNPYKPLKNLDEVQNELKVQQKLLKYYQSPFLYFLLTTAIRLKRIFKKPVMMQNADQREENVSLHGCAIIFSKKYYEKYDTIFYPNTFLYHEESFLYQRIIKDKLISIYDPSIKIKHKEGSSLHTTMNGNERKKLLFRTQEIIKSLKLLEQEMGNKNEQE